MNSKRNEDPVVTIICITYNQENCISKAIQGFIKQKTTFDFEIIIGDDHSTDNTNEIISSFQKVYPEKINVITSRRNTGSTENFIRCINRSKGEFIAYCDGDDYWIDENKLETQVNFLRNNKEYGLVYTNYHNYYEDYGFYIKNIHSKLKDPSHIGFLQLIENNIPRFSTVMFKKALYDELQQSDDYELFKSKYCGDLILLLNFSRYTKFKFFPQATTVYRITKASVSRSDSTVTILQHNKDRYEVVKYFIEKYAKDEYKIQSIKEDYIRSNLVYLNKKGEINKAAIFFRLLKDSNLNTKSDYLYRIPMALFVFKYFWLFFFKPYYIIMAIKIIKCKLIKIVGQ